MPQKPNKSVYAQRSRVVNVLKFLLVIFFFIAVGTSMALLQMALTEKELPEFCDIPDERFCP